MDTGKCTFLKKEYSLISAADFKSMPLEKKKEIFNWDFAKERVTKGCKGWELINVYLDAEKAKINQILARFEIMNKPITINSFKTAYLKPNGSHLFYEYCFEELKRRKNKMSNGTYLLYESVLNKIRAFRPNLALVDIDYKFLTDYENYLSKPINEGGLGNIKSTIANNFKKIRAFIKIAIKNGDFLKEAYPFQDYKIKHVDPVLTTRDYLEPSELIKLESLLSASQESVLLSGEIKALKRFLFSCYTGLRFADVISLNWQQNIHAKWVMDAATNKMAYKYYIEVNMGKTDRPVFIPLIDKAIEILLEMACGESAAGTIRDFTTMKGNVFENISNQKINEHLKSITSKAKLSKKISFHVARHTFATICFLYGIPLEVGQRLLGHKNRKFTEIYTHLSQNKLFYEMDKLNRGLNQFQWVVEQEENVDNIKQILPILKNLSKEKIDQLMGLVRVFGQ